MLDVDLLPSAGADRLEQVIRAMRDAGHGDLRRETLRAIRTESKPIIEALRAAVMGIDSRGVGGSRRRSGARRRAAHTVARQRRRNVARAVAGAGLRSTIRRAITLKIRTSGRNTGVSIVIDHRKLPDSQRSLPRHLDDPRGWRHPVFGTDTWVTQYGEPWWDATIREHVDDVRRGIVRAVDRVFAKMQ